MASFFPDVGYLARFFPDVGYLAYLLALLPALRDRAGKAAC